METSIIKGILKEAVEEIRQSVAVRRYQNIKYALAVRVGYEDIQMLRNEGYSYNIICEVFIAKGVLGADASPKILCKAFLRETKRRNNRTEISKCGATPLSENAKNGKDEKGGLSKLIKNDIDFEKKTAIAPVQNPASDGAKKLFSAESEQERISKMNSTKVKIGTQEIVKHTNGSFEYS